MISIRQLLFVILAIAFALGAVVATISGTWTFHVPAALFALFFLGYIATVGIMAVYPVRRNRPFWIGCTIAVLVLYVGSSSSFTPVASTLSVYEEIAKMVNRTTPNRLAADELRQTWNRASTIIRLGVIIVLSLAGGSFAMWASRRNRSQSF